MVNGVDPRVPDKATVRATVLASRRALPAEVRADEADALRGHLLAATSSGATVCAYVPVGAEPGSPDLLDALVSAGVRVLLPVAREVDGVPQPLTWGEYTTGDALVPAPFGLREPAEPWLPPATIAEADLVVVPALAVDRAGARLGRGAGYYDRTLGSAAPGTRLVAVVRDDEILDMLPAEPHDVAMTHALTPGRGFVVLGG
jgi:5-formyltetrahydrofolate cyclo-ligase